MCFIGIFLSSGLRPRLKADCGSPHRGRVTFFARAKKVTKETRPRMARYSCASRLWPPSWRHATSLSRAPGADLLVRPPSGLPAKALRCSGAPYGVGKEPRHGWCFRDPVARAEYRSPTGSFQARPCLSPRRKNVQQDERAQRAGLHFCARRVGRAPGGARNGGRSRALRGVFLFGDFFLNKQEKVTCRGSATHKYAPPQAARLTVDREAP